jgi:hypothetical protein
MNAEVMLSCEKQVEVKPEKTTTATKQATSNLIQPWGPFCEWLACSFRGIEASLERVDRNGSRVVELPNRPLVAIQAHLLANGVPAIALTFAANSHEPLWEITGVKAIHLEQDAAGFPTLVEFVSDSERVLLRFTESPRTVPVSSSNSWGE